MCPPRTLFLFTSLERGSFPLTAMTRISQIPLDEALVHGASDKSSRIPQIFHVTPSLETLSSIQFNSIQYFISIILKTTIKKTSKYTIDGGDATERRSLKSVAPPLHNIQRRKKNHYA